MKANDSIRSVSKYLLFVIIGIIVGVLIVLLTNATQGITPLITPIVSLIVGFSIPIITTYIFQRPKLSVEIGSIQRKISDTSRIYLDDYSEFSLLKDESFSYRMRRLPRAFSDNNAINGLSVNELEELIVSIKKELKDLPEIVNKRKISYEKVCEMNISEFKIYDADKLNEPISPEVEFERRDFESEKEQIYKQFCEKYKRQYEDIEKRFNLLNSNMPAIERKFEQIRADVLAQRSFFSISTTLMNSGRLNTSVRKPALLRVYIGQGNYVDLKLAMKDFELKSDINLQSTKVVEFESSEISALPEDDRKLINTYWGQSVSTVLFIEDIYSSIHSSNTISFAEGLYQKLLYDELAIAAGKKKHI